MAITVVEYILAVWAPGWPPGAWAVRRPTLHGGPVWLRPVRATPCFNKQLSSVIAFFLVCNY